MKHIAILLGAVSQFSCAALVHANDGVRPDAETVLSMAEILKWNSDYNASEPSVAMESGSQVSGTPVLPLKAPASFSPQRVAQVEAQPANIPSNNMASEDVIAEDEQNKTLVPVIVPKTETAPNVINKPAADVPAFEIGLPLLLDERYLGDISVRIAGENVSVPWPRLKTLIAPDLSEAFVQTLEGAVQDGYLELGTFQVDGMSFTYNPQLQQIEMVSTNVSRDVRVLTLGAEQRERRLTLETPADFSLFVTPIVSAEYVWDKDDPQFNDNLSPFGTVDVGGRIGGEKGVAFLSRQSFDSRDGFDVQRDETQLIYDRLPDLMRVTAGDLRPRGNSLQSIPSIAGLSVERFFDLEPNRLFRATSQTSFELERPSTVEIRINGVTQREIFLRPGRYDVRDLPLVQGSNLVDVVIRDDLGRERVISDRNFFDFGLLEKGIWDYSVAAGVRSNFGSDGIDYSDDPVATAFVRGGISDTVTVGADLQGDADGVNGGASILWATPIGVLRSGLSASERSSIGTGLATDVGFNATGFFGETAKTRWTATLGLRYNSRNFSVLPVSASEFTPLTTTPGDGITGPLDGVFGGQQSTKFNLNGGVQISQNKWSFTSNANYTQSYGNRRDTLNVIGGMNYAVTSNFSLGVFARHIRSQFDEETGVNLQLTWRPARNRDIRGRYDSIRNEAEIEYRRSAASVVGALNYGLGAISNFDTNSEAFSGDAYYIGNRFEAFARHDVFTGTGTDGSDTRQISRASLRSSFAFADGAFAVGRPISEAFAIVDQHSSLDGKKVFIDPTERGYSAATGPLGSALASELNPFSERSLYFDVDDLPVGYDLGEGQFSVKPPLNAGYRVKIGSGASFTLIGKVLNAKTGEAVPFLGGRLESLDQPEVEPILAFTNRNGRLAAVGLVPGRYTLILLTKPEFRKEITISEDVDSLVDIGELRVNMPK